MGDPILRLLDEVQPGRVWRGNETAVQRVLREVADRDRSTGCWEWDRSRIHDGYGRVRVGMDDRISHNRRAIAAARAFLAMLNFPERTTR